MSQSTQHQSAAQLGRKLEHIADSPDDRGVVEMIACRPAEDERETLDIAVLDTELGLIGDNWKARGSRRSPDGSANPKAQVTLMNSRVIDAVTGGDLSRWSLAGDQIYVDLDLSPENVPAGARLAIGDALIEVSDQPHTGCHKFASRFGAEALRFVNTGAGRENRFRGINCFVVTGGTIHTGDTVEVVPVGR